MKNKSNTLSIVLPIISLMGLLVFVVFFLRKKSNTKAVTQPATDTPSKATGQVFAGTTSGSGGSVIVSNVSPTPTPTGGTISAGSTPVSKVKSSPSGTISASGGDDAASGTGGSTGGTTGSSTPPTTSQEDTNSTYTQPPSGGSVGLGSN